MHTHFKKSVFFSFSCSFITLKKFNLFRTQRQQSYTSTFRKTKYWGTNLTTYTMNLSCKNVGPLFLIFLYFFFTFTFMKALQKLTMNSKILNLRILIVTERSWGINLGMRHTYTTGFMMKKVGQLFLLFLYFFFTFSFMKAF